MRLEYLEKIKQFEGFTAKAKWDFAQESNGYGTKARFPGEVIDKVEAEHRFAAEISAARDAVVRFAPGLDEGTAAALTSLTFNAGPGWMRSGLGAAVKAGDLESAKQIFAKYVHAGGQRLAGLEARRAAELLWIGQPESAALQPDGDVSRAGVPAFVPQGSEIASAEQPDTEFSTNLSVGASSVNGRGSPDEALARALLLETIGIVLAARRGPHERDEQDQDRRTQV